MPWSWIGWIAILAAATLAAEPPQTEPIILSGVVVELSEALDDLKIETDPGPLNRQIVLRGEEGTITPLLLDDASRALFDDARLRQRRTEIRARRHPGLPYVQVMSFRVEDRGRLCVPDYYCDVCTISVRAPQICSCCQGPMELRLRPDAP